MKIVTRLLIFILIIICLGPLYPYWENFKKFEISHSTASWGTFGDYVGGVIGTLFGLISVVFIYFTFEDQRNTSKREKFENKYYELIKLHRDNVAEIGIGRDFGKKVFILILREFREILPLIKDLNIKLSLHLDSMQIIEVAYISLFYGTGPNSTRILKKSLSSYKIHFLDDLVDELEKFKGVTKIKRTFKYVPFEGHQSRLGHYFRHIYQTIKFVDSQTFINAKEKKEYVKTIRAQLSNHEQALLLLNSLSKLGKSWNNENLIKKYSLVKNLPEDFLDPIKEIDVKALYPEIVFEWEEIDIVSETIISRKINLFWNKFRIDISKYRKI